MSYKLGKRSIHNLLGVHPDLVAVVHRAIEVSEQDFSVIEGVRSLTRQKELLAKGFTTTLNSRHLTGHAVDIVPYPVDWEDLDRFKLVAKAMKEAANELNIPIVWGGDWKKFVDMPHYQLDRKKYP